MWGSAVIGLAICEASIANTEATLERLAHMTEISPATLRRKLNRLVAIGRVEYEATRPYIVYRPHPELCDRTTEIVEGLTIA